MGFAVDIDAELIVACPRMSVCRDIFREHRPKKNKQCASLGEDRAVASYLIYAA